VSLIGAATLGPAGYWRPGAILFISSLVSRAALALLLITLPGTATVTGAASQTVEPADGLWNAVPWMATRERTAQSSSPGRALIEWTNQVATFGSGLAVAGGDQEDSRPWLLVGARALRVGERRVGGFVGLRHGRGGAGWSINFGLAGGVGDSFYGDDLVSVRDVDGDGRDELLVYCARPLAGSPYPAGWALHLSRASGWESRPSWVLGARAGAAFGFGHMASAGDVNGDGYGDVMIGVPDAEGGRGIAMLYLGSSEGLAREPAWTKEGEQAGELLGFGVAGVGDVNGDGFGDVFVGSPGHGDNQSRRGRGRVYLGQPSGLAEPPHWSASGVEDAAWFGAAAAAAGDIDADGCADFLVSAPGTATKSQRNPQWPGSISLYAGGRRPLSGQPRAVIQGVRNAELFGRSFGMVGDMDGDGDVELAVGAPRAAVHWSGQGRVDVWTVRPDFSLVPRVSIEGTAAGQRFGWRVVGADFNGDGLADLAASGPFHRPANPNSGHGMIGITWGSRTLLALNPAFRSRELSVPGTSDIESTAPLAHGTGRGHHLTIWAAGGGVAAIAGVCALGCWWRRREAELVKRERERFARDLHDHVGGHLTHLRLVSEPETEHAGDPRSRRQPNETWAAMSRQLSDSLADVIWLARSDTKRLDALTDRMIDTATTWLEAAGIACRLDVPPSLPDVALDSHRCRDALLVFKEAINNLIRHSKATRAEIIIQVNEGPWLDVQVADDGGGFPIPERLPAKSGLANMKSRVEAVGGTWSIESTPKSTRIRYRMALKAGPGV